MVIQHGEIWWAELGEPRGSAPGFARPVLIIQSDAFNQSRINTVVVMAITSNLRLASLPGNVLLSKRSSGLPKQSVANASQLLTINKTQLTKRVKKLSKAELQAIDKGLRLLLALN